MILCRSVLCPVSPLLTPPAVGGLPKAWPLCLFHVHFSYRRVHPVCCVSLSLCPSLATNFYIRKIHLCCSALLVCSCVCVVFFFMFFWWLIVSVGIFGRYRRPIFLFEFSARRPGQIETELLPIPLIFLLAADPPPAGRGMINLLSCPS